MVVGLNGELRHSATAPTNSNLAVLKYLNCLSFQLLERRNMLLEMDVIQGEQIPLQKKSGKW